MPDVRIEEHARVIAGLGIQIAELKEMVGEIVRYGGRTQTTGHERLTSELKALEGAWFNESSKSSIYVSVVGDRVIAPYSYGGREDLTAYYYDWKKVGDFFFARFQWVTANISGFTFLRLTTADTLQGEWWYDDVDYPVGPLNLGGETGADKVTPINPPSKSGRAMLWRRMQSDTPGWAAMFVREFQEKGKVPDSRSDRPETLWLR
jgi:hypothetical protein